MNTRFWWWQSKIKQGCFNKYSKVKHCFKINSRSSKQDQEKDKASNNLTSWLVFCLKTNYFQEIKDTGNRLREINLKISFSKGFRNLNFESCNRLPNGCNRLPVMTLQTTLWKVMILKKYNYVIDYQKPVID